MKINIRSRKTLAALIAVAIVFAALAIIYYSYQRPQNIKKMLAEADSLVVESMNALNTDSFALAFHNLSEAMSIYTSQKNKKGEMTVRTNLAIVYYGLELFDNANNELSVVNKNVNFLDTTYQIVFYRIDAIVKTIVNKEYDLAIKQFKRGIELDSASGNKLAFVQDIANLAEVYIYNKQNEKAHEMLRKIEETNLGKKEEFTSQYFFCKGKLYFEEKQYDEAYETLQRCLAYSTRYNQPHLKLQAIDILRTIDSIRGDNTNYIKNMHAYISLNDSISGNRITNEISRLQEQQKIELEREAYKKRHILMVVYFTAGLILVALLAVIFFMMYRRTEQTKRLVQLEAEKLDSEIMLERMQNELLRLKVEQNGEELKEARKENLSMSLQLASFKEQSNDTESLQIFDDTYMQLNETFGKELRERYPRLTANEQRFLYLIKLGLTSQEMMSVLNISSSGLYKMRYRLKKKLNLSGDQTIEQFLATIG